MRSLEAEGVVAARTFRDRNRRGRGGVARALFLMPVAYASDGRKLPAGWEEKMDEDGQTYFWHARKSERMTDFP